MRSFELSWALFSLSSNTVLKVCDVPEPAPGYCTSAMPNASTLVALLPKAFLTFADDDQRAVISFASGAPMNVVVACAVLLVANVGAAMLSSASEEAVVPASTVAVETVCR